MKKKSISLARLSPVLLLCFLCLIPAARADMGPKQEVTITVVNAPEGELYLDLLAEGKPAGAPGCSLDESEYDPAILARLCSLEGNGWVLSYSTGLGGAPIFGGIRPQEDGSWWFGYFGLRETFRVAAATADAAQAVETPYTRQFVSNIVYDWETNTVRDATPSPLRFAARLLATLVPTLVIEGLLFWLFGFRERRSWLIFLAVNMTTQLGLHLVVGHMAGLSGWSFLFGYFFRFLIPELAILIIEAAIYALLLKEHDRRQRVGYAVLANVASFLLGYFPLHLLYGFLKSL